MRWWRTEYVTLLVALALAAGVFAVACGGGKETDAVKLVPAGTNLIAQANLRGILASDGLASIFGAFSDNMSQDEGDPQSLDELLDEAMAETGVDFRQFAQVVIFADISRNDEFVGLIVTGTYDEAAIVAAIERGAEGPVGTSDYKGRRVYSFDGDPDQPSLAFLGDDTMVLGSAEAVRAVIDVQDGDRQRASDSLLEAFDDLGRGLLFRLELEVSVDDLLGQVLDLGGVPFLGDGLGNGIEGLPGALGALRDLKLLGLALGQNGQILILRANLDFAGAASASAIGDFLDGIVKLAGGLSPDQQTRELLDGLQISRNGSRLTIRLEATGSELGGLVTGVSGLPGAGVSVPEEPKRPPRYLEPGEDMAIMPTNNHVPEGGTVVYNTVPPTSGDHWPSTAACGFYEETLPDELIVHNLEHGNILVSYNFTGQQAKDQLRTAIDSIDQAGEWGVVRFYDKIPEGTVAVAAWGRLDLMQGVEQDRIARFFATFAGNLGPERIPC